MMKIIVVCGMGLGSSHFMAMNLIEILKEEGISAEVENCDLMSAGFKEADIFMGADYMMDSLENDAEKIGLENILDKEEIRAKIIERISENASR